MSTEASIAIRRHGRNIMQALRGKTLIDLVRIDSHDPVVQTVARTIGRVSSPSLTNVSVVDSIVILRFTSDFVQAVTWDAASAVDDVLGFLKVVRISVHAHQLFCTDSDFFVLTLSRNQLSVSNSHNIEATLCLDLKRYCQENYIKWKAGPDERKR